jgi:muconolactone delta-isomerase
MEFAMQYLVQMRLANPSRPTTVDVGLAFIEQYILPTLERCEQLQTNNTIGAGGPVSGAVALDLIVNADTAQGLDEVITGLPVWPMMETTITALTTFADRRQAVLAIHERLAKAAHEGAGAAR